MAKILIGLPAFNEESYIGTMVLKCKQYADEVIVCDDGSTDETAKVALLAGATVISNGKNMGVGATVQHILTEAKRKTFDVLVTLDSDTQHSPTDIPRLAQKVLEGYDLVIGARNIKDIPRFRAVGGKVLSAFTNVLSKVNISDSQSGFRAFSVKAVRDFELKEHGFPWASEMLNQATRLNFKITEVPISIKYTKNGSTLNPVVQGSDTLARILHMISKRKPLAFFGLGGLVLTIAGLAIGVNGYQMFLTNKVLPVGTVLLSIMLLIIGILGVFTGIILNAMRRE